MFRTVRRFGCKEQITDLGLIEQAFELFLKELESLGLVVNEGKIVDVSFVEVPRQRNRRGENEQIKNGEVPEDFKKNPNKLAQKDVDAKWTQKNKVNYYGYKNHIKCDSKSKLIVKYLVTDAAVHDSNATEIKTICLGRCSYRWPKLKKTIDKETEKRLKFFRKIKKR